MKTITFIICTILLNGCMTSSDKKLFIKSIQANEAKRIDWYFYSLIGGFSRSYLQYEDKKTGKQVFFESFYLSDISRKNDTLIIQLYENDYKLDNKVSINLDLVVKIDTTGGQWNMASSRLGRLNKENIDITKHHFADSYCPKNECY